MRYLAKEMEQQYRTKFRSLSQEFLDTCGSDPSKCLQSVMRELVGDGKLNWGRVVSIFTFTGVLASELLSRGENSECSRRLAETIADYLGGEKQDWLVENGGWVSISFVDWVYTFLWPPCFCQLESDASQRILGMLVGKQNCSLKHF
uniref:BCL2 like 10 n=1 Tax=Cyprinus carpio TaxID=7962 RepID=A0A8C2FFQ8_CYPCA